MIWRVSPKCSLFLVILIEVPMLTGCLFVYMILINLFFFLLRVEFLNLSKGTSTWFSFIRWLWVWSPGDSQGCPSRGMWRGWRLPPYVSYREARCSLGTGVHTAGLPTASERLALQGRAQPGALRWVRSWDQRSLCLGLYFYNKRNYVAYFMYKDNHVI